MKIENVKINHIANPVGYDLSNLRASWDVTEAQGKRVKESRIVVFSDEALACPVYDSGFKKLDSLGAPIDLELSPRKRYYLTVSARTDSGDEATSEAAFFETGKLGEPWTAKWITEPEKGDRRPVFSKRISFDGGVAKARLYICGLGLYEARIDGKKIGDELMTPYCNDYDRWVQYQTYDVTDMLKSGSDISVTIGDGWYLSRIRFGVDTPTYYGTERKLIAELHIDLTDGTHVVVPTDESWLVSRSKVTFDSIYDGEKVDLTLEDEPAVGAVVTDAPKHRHMKDGTAPEAILSERFSLPVRILEELPGKTIITPKGETVVDIEQNTSGIFRFKVDCPKGTRVYVQVGEVLQDDCFYRDNLRSALAEYEIICDGEERVVEPRFTFYGYRFAKITVNGGDQEAEKKIASTFVGLAVSTDIDDTGCITTGNAKVNRLIKNIFWGCRSNFLDVPTDCPQRDERLGWTGDANVFSPSAMYLHDAYAFFAKYLHDMAFEQLDADGCVPHIVPSFGMDGGSCVWSDAAIAIPYYLWRAYGDTSIIKAQYASMTTWLDYIIRTDGDGMHYRDRFHFGDWVALDLHNPDPDNSWGATDIGYLADVHFMEDAKRLAEMSRAIGYDDTADDYLELAEKIKKRIEDEYFTSTGRCAVDTQCALLLALKHDLGSREKIKDRLRQKIEYNGGKLDCGFIGATFMLEQLSASGMDDIAVKLLLNEEYPGWLYEVNHGATTIWERWNSIDETGHISSTGMNSLNHYAFGSVLKWMYEYMAGLRPTSPGFKICEISPIIIKELGFCDMKYRSASGLWQVRWETGDKTKIHIAVPFGCSAVYVAPDGEKQKLSCGEYDFEYDA